MSKKEKKMMSTKKCASIFVPLSAFTLAIAIAVPIFSNIFSPTLNTVFGQGELVTEENKNIEQEFISLSMDYLKKYLSIKYKNYSKANFLLLNI